MGQQDTLREVADLRALRECHTVCGCQMSSQAIGFILCAQQYLLFSPCKTEKTKEKYIECYLEMNQLYKPMSFSPCHAVGWSCRLAGAVCHRLQHSTQPCSPHRQHHGGSQWVPGTHPASGLGAETPQSGCCWALRLCPSPVFL